MATRLPGPVVLVTLLLLLIVKLVGLSTSATVAPAGMLGFPVTGMPV